MNFCQHTMPAIAGFVPDDGILALPAQRVTSDALVAADQIRSDAAAQALHEQALADASAAAMRAQLYGDTLAQAQSMLTALDALQQRFLDQAAPIAADLAQALFLRLAGQLAPFERVAAMLHQLRQHAPSRLADPVLRVHPVDAAMLEHANSVPAAWRLEADPALTPGQARLEAASGEWRFDFDGAVAALATSLQTAK